SSVGCPQSDHCQVHHVQLLAAASAASEVRCVDVNGEQHSYIIGVLIVTVDGVAVTGHRAYQRPANVLSQVEAGYWLTRQAAWQRVGEVREGPVVAARVGPLVPKFLVNVVDDSEVLADQRQTIKAMPRMLQ